MSKTEYETGMSRAELFEFWSRQFEKWQQKIREMQQRSFQLSADVAVSEVEELSDVLYDAALHLMDAEKSLDAARDLALKKSLQEHRQNRRS